MPTVSCTVVDARHARYIQFIPCNHIWESSLREKDKELTSLNKDWVSQEHRCRDRIALEQKGKTFPLELKEKTLGRWLKIQKIFQIARRVCACVSQKKEDMSSRTVSIKL